MATVRGDASRTIFSSRNSSCVRRRTHSDSSLHYAMMPTVAAHYHARVNHDDYGWSCNSFSIHLLSSSIYLDQQLSYDVNDIEFDLSPFTGHQQQQQHQHQFQPQEQPLEQQPFQAQYPYDFNNNHHYPQEQINMMHPLSQIPMPQQQQQPTTTAPSSSHNHSHTPLGPRYSGGNSSSNVLMLPPNQNPRGGGSLPDLRMGDMNHHHHHHQVSYSTTPSPPSSATQRLFRSPSSEQNNEADLFIWVNISAYLDWIRIRLSLSLSRCFQSPQQRLPSNIGPLKQSPSVHRRHSPIADGRPSSPRRQNSPSPDVSPVGPMFLSIPLTFRFLPLPRRVITRCIVVNHRVLNHSRVILLNIPPACCPIRTTTTMPSLRNPQRTINNRTIVHYRLNSIRSHS